MKEIKDYIHLYLKCNVFFDSRIWRMFKVADFIVHLSREGESTMQCYPHDVKPILRRKASLTEQEIFKLFSFGGQMEGFIMDTAKADDNNIQISGLKYGNRCSHWSAGRSFTPEETHYLLGLGIDLFGLIDSGLAIDKDTLK